MGDVGTRKLDRDGMVDKFYGASNKPKVFILKNNEGNLDAVIETYSDLRNCSQVFELKTKLGETRQETLINLGVTECFILVNNLLQELDQFYEADWGDPETNVKFWKFVEKERIYDFLTGLNKDLNEVRG